MDRLNEILAARLGVEQIESIYDSIRVARLVGASIDRRMRDASKSDNLSSIEKIQYQLTIVYREVDEIVRNKAPFFLQKHSRNVVKILRNAILGKDIEESRKSIARQVFGQIPKEIIDRIVRNQNVPARILKAMQKTRMTPQAYAQVVAIQRDPAIRASLVANYFRMLRNTAYTVTRTNVAAMMGQVRLENYGALPRDLVGFQVHGILDERIRPAHRERNGNIYFRNPRYGQLGMDEMPNPPLEADGSTAFNCRCWLTPILASFSNKFYDFKGRIIPNAQVFNEWFSGASRDRQILAVGVRRWNIANSRLKKGEVLQWHHLLDPSSGMLLDSDELSNETPTERANRIKRAKTVIAKV